jgi:hypothetical protein
MLQDQELLHGAALLRLIESGNQTRTTFDFCKDLHLSMYVVTRDEARAGLLLKLSTGRRAPWGFTFTSGEEHAISVFTERHPGVPIGVGLVCGRDGICCVGLDLLENLLDPGQAISGKRFAVRRPQGGSYWISGPGRISHPRAIPMSDWPSALFEGATLDPEPSDTRPLHR